MAVAADFAQANLIMAQTYPALITALGGDEDALAQLNAVFGAVVLPEKISEFFEFTYARRADLPAVIKEAGADVGHFAWLNGFWGLGENGRGSRMERVLRGQSLSKGEEVPEPSAKYAAATAAQGAAATPAATGE